MDSGNKDGNEAETVKELLGDGDEYFVGEEPPNQLSLVNLDRERGILTPADRRFLVGEADFGPKSQSARRARQRIRNRIRESMRDYFLLLNYLEDRDLNQAFGKKREGEWTIFDDVISVFPAAIGFLYAGTIAYPDNDVGIFETRVAAGVAAAEEARNGRLVTIDIDIDIGARRDIEDLVALVEQEGAEADEITPAVMNRLFKNHHIDKELYADVMEDLLQE